MLILFQPPVRHAPAQLPRAQGQHGATLIELIIGLVIVGMLFLLGAPSIASWIQNSKIRTAAEGMQSGLQLARAEAVRRNTLVRFDLVTDLTNACVFAHVSANWVVSLDNPAGPAGLCDAAPNDTVAPFILQTHSSASGGGTTLTVNANTSPSGTPPNGTNLAGAIIFNGLGRLAARSNITAGDQINIDISNPVVDHCLSDVPAGSARCLRVVVTTAGQIRMCDPAFAFAVNPLGC